jgi:enoyl-CoA hydratase/carnithine racemase
VQDDAEPLVIFERDQHIGYIVLNGPEKLNPLTNARLEALDRAFNEAEANEDVRVVILKGAGRAFSSGYSMDPANYLRERPGPVEDAVHVASLGDRLLRIWEFPKPVIAQVHGYCFAGGTQLAAVADITLVAEDAVIGLPQMPLGGGFISPIWVHLVGPKRAKEMSFVAGSKISGAEAADWGWANRAVPADELDNAARSLATRIAATSPHVLRLKKLAINFAADGVSMRQLIQYGSTINTIAQTDPAVMAMRQRIGEEGLKETLKSFRGEVDANVEQMRRDSAVSHPEPEGN